jgi:hypothetical protein
MISQQKLSGSVNLVRALAGHDLWFTEKFCRQAALVDLLLLANTEDTTAPARGGTRVDVARGCVAYSIQSLARRWQWSDVKVSGYLRELAQHGVVKTASNANGTVIRFVNYDTYNPPHSEADLAGDLATELVAETAPDLAAGLATDLAQSRSRRNYIGQEGELEKSPLPPKGAGEQGPELPSREEVLAYCATVGLGPIPADFAATRIADYDGRAIGWPRNWRRALLSDWLNPLRRAEFTKAMAKNGAEKTPAKTVSASVRAIATRDELETMQADLDQLPHDDFRKAQQAKLDARWRELEALEGGK